MDGEARDIEHILSSMRHLAVVGISPNRERPSWEVADYLLRQGFTVSPVNPLIESIFDQPCFADIGAVGEAVDVVVVFRRSSEAGAVVDAAIAAGARAVWLQEGVIDEAAAARARAAGLRVVMDRCILKEHAAGKARQAALP